MGIIISSAIGKQNNRTDVETEIEKNRNKQANVEIETRSAKKFGRK